MRHPVSTLGKLKGNGSTMQVRLVRGSGEPGTPEHAHPSAREDANGVRVITASGAGAVIDGGSPGTAMTRLIGEASKCAAQAVVASPAEGHRALLAGLVGHWRDTCFGSELSFGREALAHAAQFSQDLGGADAAAAREGHDDLAIGEACDGVLDARGEFGELRDQALKDAGEAVHEFAFGFGFELADAALSGASQALEKHPHGAAPTIGVL